MRTIGKEPDRVRVKVTVKAETYSILRKTPPNPEADEAAALRVVIERGMERYWPHWFDELVTHFEILKGRYEECQRDNKQLRGLIVQNEELGQITTDSKEAPK